MLAFKHSNVFRRRVMKYYNKITRTNTNIFIIKSESHKHDQFL